MTGATTLPLSYKDTLEKFYYQGWNKRNADVVRECMDPNVKFRMALSGRQKRQGVENFVDYMKRVHGSLARQVSELEDLVEDKAAHKVAAKLQARGVHKDGTFFGVQSSTLGGELEVSWSCAVFATFSPETGKIVDLWVLGDIDGLKRQLGASIDAVAFS